MNPFVYAKSMTAEDTFSCSGLNGGSIKSLADKPRQPKCNFRGTAINHRARRDVNLKLLPEWLSTGNSGSFPNSKDLVRLNILDESTAPLGQRISRRSARWRFPQPEVDPQIVLRQIARSRLDLPDQNLPVNEKLQPRANAVSIAFGPDGADQNGVGAISSVVLEARPPFRRHW